LPEVLAAFGILRREDRAFILPQFLYRGTLKATQQPDHQTSFEWYPILCRYLKQTAGTRRILCCLETRHNALSQAARRTLS